MQRMLAGYKGEVVLCMLRKQGHNRLSVEMRCQSNHWILPTVRSSDFTTGKILHGWFLWGQEHPARVYF
jgi:hypothetical protein